VSKTRSDIVATCHGVRRCVPSQCHKRGSCRFHFPYLLAPSPLAFVEHSDGKERKRFSPVRNDPWLNQHSKPVLLAWRANQELQPVLDRTTAIKYVSKYVSKPETVSDSYNQALTAFCSRLPRHLPAETAVQSLFEKMTADRDISAQEAGKTRRLQSNVREFERGHRRPSRFARPPPSPSHPTTVPITQIRAGNKSGVPLTLADCHHTQITRNGFRPCRRDLGRSEFASGLLFVALSRCTSFYGLRIQPFDFQRYKRIEKGRHVNARRQEFDRLRALATATISS
jgi:hypothetical protein